MEPPLCPDSEAAMNFSPKLAASLNASILPNIAAAILVVFAIAIALWRLRRPVNTKRPPSLQSSPTQTAASLAAKINFLERVGKKNYGYVTSKKGFIDDWRLSEFPTLIPSLKLPTHIHGQKQCSDQTNKYWESQHTGINCDGASEPEVYLDYAGSAIPTQTLLSQISHQSQILANPHSLGGGMLSSDRTLKLMQMAKDRVMQHFGVQHETFGLDVLDKDEGENNASVGIGEDKNRSTPCPGYQLVFTSGATESLRLVAERFPWSSPKITAGKTSHMILSNMNTDTLQSSNHDNSTYLSKQMKSIQARSILLYPRNVHTSVIGMREAAMQRGARFHCVSVDELVGATCEWFQNLVEGSMSFEFQEAKMRDVGGKIEEKKDEHGIYPNIRCSSHAQDITETPTPCKEIWMHHLLVLPMECNFGGDRFDWRNTTAVAHKPCSSSYLHGSGENSETSATIRICHKWHILLDTAKAAATGPVNIPTLTHGSGPDFAVVSFYKMFGAPTGLGALFVKKQRRKSRSGMQTTKKRDATLESNASEGTCVHTCGISTLHLSGGTTIERRTSPRHFFGGGSVDVVLPESDFVVPRNANGAASVSNKVNESASSDEDETIDLGVLVHGTEHFRGIASLIHGFQELDALGGMEAISTHCTCLSAEFVHRLSKLVHDNGTPVIELYGQWKSLVNRLPGMDTSNTMQYFPGPTVAFNICDRDGSLIGYDEVSRLASLNCPPIQLRTGCFCNPGACQDALPLTNSEVLENYSSGHVCGDRRGIVNGKPTGAIRASFGKDSSYEDMDALATFIGKVFISQREAVTPLHSSEESEGNPPDTCNKSMKIDSLFVFPIKSCAAMRVNRWPINRRTGRMSFDREFALVDTSGLAMRLHSYPQMSKIQPSIDLNTMILTVSAQNHEDLILNIEKSKISVDNMMSPEDIQVCGTLCKGNIWGGSKASRWFSDVLGVRCWLARHHATYKTGRTQISEARYAYCNEASLLLVSQQSISYLNSVITAQGWGRLVESRHFRPNIVVVSRADTQIEERRQFVNPEDSWQQISIRGSADVVELTAAGKCARCQMVDVDPISGMKGNTLRALAQYRRDRGQINFGSFFTGNADASDETAWVEEGSEVISNGDT
ncbi:hypothetical protein ACHAXR_012843 [Thalassiosira sp. AJA248-18]